LLAIIGVVLAVLAGILEIVSKHTNYVIGLLIVAVILIGAEVAWGRPWVNYRRGGPPVAG
jgi:hypothetical protein